MFVTTRWRTRAVVIMAAKPLLLIYLIIVPMLYSFLSFFLSFYCFFFFFLQLINKQKFGVSDNLLRNTWKTCWSGLKPVSQKTMWSSPSSPLWRNFLCVIIIGLDRQGFKLAPASVSQKAPPSNSYCSVLPTLSERRARCKKSGLKVLLWKESREHRWLSK